MSTRDWRVYARDSNLNITGQLSTWSKFTMVSRYMRAGSWTMELPGSHPQANLIVPGMGITVFSPGSSSPTFSGPATAISRSSVDGFATSSVTVTGIDDTGTLAFRQAWPNPTRTIDLQDVDAADVVTGPAEDVICAYISQNAGATCQPGRAITGIDTLVSGGSGSVVTGSARFDSLLALCEQLALSGGIGFQLIQSGTKLQLLFSSPAVSSVRFSSSVGNLKSWNYNFGFPTGSAAIVAGAGSGTTRTLAESIDTASEIEWGMRTELFVDARDTSDPDVLDERGTAALVSGAATASLSVTPISKTGSMYGTDYRIGDLVTVVVDGTAFEDTVRTVTVELDGPNETITADIGNPDLAGNTPQIYNRVRDIHRRIGQIERRL